MNVAVILAGGSGRRFGSPTPKQFLQLAGKTVIEHSIDTFCLHQGIDEVVVVVHPDYRDTMQSIADRRAWLKLRRIIDGGEERYLSSLNAIRALSDYSPDTNLLLHDAARPMLTAEIIDRVIGALRHSYAAGVGIPSTDTIWEVDIPSRTIVNIPDRRLMWRAQTPQAFRLEVLREAYSRAMEDPHFTSTDDCGVIARYVPDIAIAVVEGDERNFKITNADDLRRAESIINEK